VEVLGPIPAGEVAVRASVERPGRAIALLGAELEAGGRVVLRRAAWRIAPATPPPWPAAPRPDARTGAGAVAVGTPEGWLPGYLDALEWRWLSGGLGEPGPGRAWARPLIPLVAGEESTPWQRLALVADSANGIGAPLDLRRWLFVNTELTLHLHRPPRGEWIGVDARTAVGRPGWAPRRASCSTPPAPWAAPPRPWSCAPGEGQSRPSMARQDRISDASIARAPRSASSSITRLAWLRLTIERTADQPFSVSGDTVGACMPGLTRLASSSRSSGQS
jgi:hypothetical protein